LNDKTISSVSGLQDPAGRPDAAAAVCDTTSVLQPTSVDNGNNNRLTISVIFVTKIKTRSRINSRRFQRTRTRII